MQQGFKRLFVSRSIEYTYNPENRQFRTFAKPSLVRFHYLPGMSALAYIVSKAVRHFLAVTNVSVVSIGQVMLLKRERQSLSSFAVLADRISA
jgi:hypothetical protein